VVFDGDYTLGPLHMTGQVKSYVEDIVRSTIPRMELDAAFEAKDEIAHAIRDSLQHVRPPPLPCRPIPRLPP
jgi:regulator of protease activity HflC (stomatin/prohibitin superfamily)